MSLLAVIIVLTVWNPYTLTKIYFQESLKTSERIEKERELKNEVKNNDESTDGTEEWIQE